MYKYPLKALKALDNVMSSYSCRERVDNLLLIIRQSSFDNFWIFNELAYFYFVKKIFPTSNPSFDNVSLYNIMALWKLEDMTKDNIKYKIIDTEKIKLLNELWKKLINDVICDNSRDISELQYIELLKSSIHH